MGAKSVLMADTLYRLIKLGTDPAIPDLDVGIAEVLKIKPTTLKSLQEETKADPVLSPLREHIIHGWSDKRQELPDNLLPYGCFRDELAILDGLIVKGNRVVAPSVLFIETLRRLHDGNQGLSATLQRARRTAYWPNLQDDISTMIQSCSECQVHANKKPRSPELQPSACHPMEIIGVDLMDFRGQSAVVAVDYFSGYITMNFIQDGPSSAVVKSLKNNQKIRTGRENHL